MMIRYLNIRGCESVSDKSLGALAKSCHRIRSLDVGKCDVTDEGIVRLAQGCSGLRKLSLRGLEMISDAGLMAVAGGCSHLVQLNIQDCSQVTVDAYLALKKSCRRCVIEHTNPGFCWKLNPYLSSVALEIYQSLQCDSILSLHSDKEGYWISGSTFSRVDALEVENRKCAMRGWAIVDFRKFRKLCFRK